MLLHFGWNWRDGMTFAVFFNADSHEDHKHDEGNDAFFFRSKDEEVHSRALLRNITPP
jgi:hypothetical protein